MAVSREFNIGGRLTCLHFMEDFKTLPEDTHLRERVQKQASQTALRDYNFRVLP